MVCTLQHSVRVHAHSGVGRRAIGRLCPRLPIHCGPASARRALRQHHRAGALGDPRSYPRLCALDIRWSSRRNRKQPSRARARPPPEPSQRTRTLFRRHSCAGEKVCVASPEPPVTSVTTRGERTDGALPRMAGCVRGGPESIASACRIFRNGTLSAVARRVRIQGCRYRVLERRSGRVD